MRGRFSLFSRISYCTSVQDVRVRFAPSPTGNLHLGSLRTALYNYLFAKHYNGKFILRIEDTDQRRLLPESVSQIHRVLDHYGLTVDEGPRNPGQFGPYVQSERLNLYREHVDELLNTSKAYRCFCSETRLDLLRKDALRNNSVPKYDRKCRSINKETSRARAENGEPFVIRFKMDKEDVNFKDEVFGDVSQCIDESDMVLLKSDGYPTYHLANVVDDREMRISHVIRGMEWLSSTGKHVLLYRAFGWSAPNWVHLSLITRDGKKKLSKRDKDAFVDYYEQDLGALPEAVLNLLVRNGSGIRDFTDRFYTLNEMVELFDLSSMKKRNLQLDLDSLEASSRRLFQNMDNHRLIDVISARIAKDCPNSSSIDTSKENLGKIITFLRTNEERFAYLPSLTKGEFKWLLGRPVSTDELLKVTSRETAKDVIRLIIEKGLDTESLKHIPEATGVSYSKVMSIIRVSLIGSTSGPPISELLSYFGLDSCRERLLFMLGML